MWMECLLYAIVRFSSPMFLEFLFIVLNQTCTALHSSGGWCSLKRLPVSAVELKTNKFSATVHVHKRRDLQRLCICCERKRQASRGWFMHVRAPAWHCHQDKLCRRQLSSDHTSGLHTWNKTKLRLFCENNLPLCSVTMSKWVHNYVCAYERQWYSTCLTNVPCVTATLRLTTRWLQREYFRPLDHHFISLRACIPPILSSPSV